MPARDTPTALLPGALAQQRMALDALLRDRVRAMLAPTSTAPDGAPVDVPDEVSDRAAALDALVREFAEQVDRENDTRQRTAGPTTLLTYGQAVLVVGDRGPVLVHADDWTATPAYVETRAGRVDRVVHGADLMLVLTGADDPQQVGAALTRLGLA